VVNTASTLSELDAAGRAALAVDNVEPRLYARPESVEAFGAALGAANVENLAVLPRGGGSQISLGNPPGRADLVLDTTALDRVIEYEPADLTVTVEAGLRLDRLQALLAERGQFLALDPPCAPEATIGGLIATNASGPLRFAFGSARDLVIGTRVANADGRLTRAGGRVVKNVAGYDLNKLYIGSLGTVGVVVELSFKVAPIPPATGVVAARFDDSDAARAFVAAVVRSPLNPLAIELLAPAAAVAAGLGDGLTAVLRVGGYEQTVARQVRDLSALAEREGGALVETAEGTWPAVWGLPLATRGEADAGARQPREVLLKAAVPISQSVAALQTLGEALGRLGPLAWSHAGSGVVYAAFGRPGDPAEHLRDAVLDARRRMLTLGGNASLVVERCPWYVKAGLDVWGDPGDGLHLMRALKDQLDPRRILNPGRYVGGI
jgi:glycolate oxidase FAD binding subunit